MPKKDKAKEKESCEITEACVKESDVQIIIDALFETIEEREAVRKELSDYIDMLDEEKQQLDHVRNERDAATEALEHAQQKIAQHTEIDQKVNCQLFEALGKIDGLRQRNSDISNSCDYYQKLAYSNYDKIENRERWIFGISAVSVILIIALTISLSVVKDRYDDLIHKKVIEIKAPLNPC